MDMGAFDSAWDLLKMRSSGGVRRPGAFRRFNRPAPTPQPPQQPVDDRGIRVDESSLAEIKRQAAQAQRQKENHLQNLKQTDPEAYQKYLMEMSMGVGAGSGADGLASNMAEMIGSMRDGNQ